MRLLERVISSMDWWGQDLSRPVETAEPVYSREGRVIGTVQSSDAADAPGGLVAADLG
jgi:hypothetical protein